MHDCPCEVLVTLVHEAVCEVTVPQTVVITAELVLVMQLEAALYAAMVIEVEL